MTAYDYVAFFAMLIVFCGLIYMVIWLGDLPANIASSEIIRKFLLYEQWRG